MNIRLERFLTEYNYEQDPQNLRILNDMAMNNPFFQELSYSNAVHFKEYIDRLSMFNPTIAQLRAEQMRIEEMKQRAAIDIFHGFPRKSSWAKIEEEVTMAYESLCRKYEHSFCSASAITVADIITQYRKEHPDPAPAPVLVFPHSIFREFYHKVVVNEEYTEECVG